MLPRENLLKSKMVQLITLDSKEAVGKIRSWEQEDSYFYTIENSPSSLLNKRARSYPYIASGSVRNLSGSSTSTPVPLKGPIYIVYLDPRSDSGLPHTRGMSGIALPIYHLWSPNEKTMQHELVHLSQKQFKDRWWQLYSKVWGFRVASKEEFLEIPERLRSRRRINPDTLGNPYVVWSERYIPLSLFVEELDPELSKCKRGFWDLEISQWTWEEPPGWIRMFGQGFNDEHPNEIAAHWLDGSAGPEKADFIKNAGI